MKRIKARELLNYTTDELWNLLTGNIILVFDNGEEVITNAKETLYSHYAWDFHRYYQDTPLLPKHHINTILKGNRLGSDTHLVLLGNCMWSVYDQYVKYETANTEVQLRDTLAEKIYRITNLMYNDLTNRLEEYVTSLDITDFSAALNHPDIKLANEIVVSSQTAIDDNHNTIKKVLLDGVSLKLNPLSLAVRSKIASMGQVLQCVGARGFLTDTNSIVFKTAILRGYAQGIRSFHDSIIESRSAAKSLIFSKSPLQQAEYFSRRLQLMAQIVQNLHMGDCGTKEYLHWKVRGPIFENGVMSNPGNLKQLIGKNYLDDDGILKQITADSKDLIGRTLKIRSVIHCAHPDQYGICSTCFGQLSLSIPEGTNIGQACCTSLASKSSQNVLSVKHHDGSSVVDAIILSMEDRKYLTVASDNNSYLLSDLLKKKTIKLIIPSDKAQNLTDIIDAKSITDLNITRISELQEIAIFISDSKSECTVKIDVNLGRRLASMTYALLAYIRKYGWDVDSYGNYTFDMKDWDWSKPILTLPLKHINMADHSAK